MSNLLRNLTNKSNHLPRNFFQSFMTLIVLLAVGTVFYAEVEGWSYFDAFYFTVITITTVGYGDLYPTTPLSKVFTIILIFMGVGLVLYVINAFTKSFRLSRERRLNKLEKLINKLKKL